MIFYLTNYGDKAFRSLEPLTIMAMVLAMPLLLGMPRAVSLPLANR